MELEWEDPPIAERGRGARKSEDVSAIVAELQAQPGRFAIVRRGVKHQSSAPGPALRKLGCEVTTRTDSETKEVRIYARWPKEAAA